MEFSISAFSKLPEAFTRSRRRSHAVDGRTSVERASTEDNDSSHPERSVNVEGIRPPLPPPDGISEFPDSSQTALCIAHKLGLTVI